MFFNRFLVFLVVQPSLILGLNFCHYLRVNFCFAARAALKRSLEKIGLPLVRKARIFLLLEHRYYNVRLSENDKKF